jgi:outer membrane protein TolC
METSSLKTTIAIGLCLVAGSTLSMAQSLEDYIREGLKNNLVLEQKNISLKQAQQSLRIAKSYFLPSINLLADYTSGKGGRSIAIPVGDAESGLSIIKSNYSERQLSTDCKC